MSFDALAAAGPDPECALVEHVHSDGAFAPEDFQRVLRLARSVRDREDGLWAALEVEDGAGRILDVTQEEDIPVDGPDNHGRAEQVEKHLYAVAAEVEHRPAARETLVQQPAARVVWARLEALERVHLRDDGRAYLTRT